MKEQIDMDGKGVTIQLVHQILTRLTTTVVFHVINCEHSGLVRALDILNMMQDRGRASEPRWVWLPLGDGVNGVFDANRIASVRSGSKPCTTIINDNWREETMIFAHIIQVCVKLGIPVEGE